MRAVIRDLILSPDPSTLPEDPAGFVFVEAATRDGIADQLRFLGGWEFENYQP